MITPVSTLKSTIVAWTLGACVAVLGISVITNVLLFRERDTLKAENARTNLALKSARDAGDQCSTEVSRLDTEAKDAAKLHAKEIADAIAFERKKQKASQTILATPATRPGDDCGSAKDRALNWLKGTP